MKLDYSNPVDVGVNPASVEKLSDMFTNGDITANAIVMVRHGKVFSELYKSLWNRDNYQMVFSVTKSIVSIAAGFAASEGLITVNDSVISYFNDIVKEPVDENMKLMKIEHLLTMTSGHLADGECEKGEWIEYNNILKNFLLNPVPNKPGEKFAYNTDGVNILSQIIERASGIRFDKYVQERLFAPLGIENYQWDDEIEESKIVNAGYGLHLHAGDLAKIGLLMLNGGKWSNIQLLDSVWIERSSYVLSNGGEYGYGYLFWRSKLAKSYMAQGMDGQYCVIMPEQDMVIVLFCANGETLQTIWDIILPALDSGKC
ncbi:MAG: beta-lactamase family protein [Oscillospiraceae bacterium]|nr:beta-lactamase family protein [Oscillospiraceae bacterium]